MSEIFVLTARQYGEVVLPDVASGQNPGTRQLTGHKAITVQGGYGTCFCRPGTKFIEHYEYRGTNLINETDLSRCNKCYKMGTSAVSRYKLSRSQKTVMVQDLNCVQVSVSGFSNFLKAVLKAVVEAKTVTNNLPILSVLAAAFLFFKVYQP